MSDETPSGAARAAVAGGVPRHRRGKSGAASARLGQLFNWKGTPPYLRYILLWVGICPDGPSPWVLGWRVSNDGFQPGAHYTLPFLRRTPRFRPLPTEIDVTLLTHGTAHCHTRVW